ncbi:MAG: SMP-30/gluconolactonase/LRE family protein [Myxococcales bacterium]|nr:SMP-30/gluconolactonase/LRE family protein [Myxococcales bacterium]
MQRLFLASMALVVLGCGDDDTSGDADAARDAAPLADAAPSDAAPVDADLTDVGANVDPDGGADAGGPPPRCPAGSESLTLSLDGARLERVPGVPVRDGFADGWAVVEGPVWARGALYVTHFPGGATPPARIYRVAEGSVSVVAPSAGTNGLALGTDGRLYGGRHADGSISVFDWDDLSAPPTPVVRTYAGARFNSPNDLAFRSDGHLYFTDPDWQAPATRPQTAERAYHVTPDGSVTPIDGAPNKPNGVTLSLDESSLFISGQNGLRRFDLGADGAVVGRGMNVPAVSGGLDGMGLDCAGNLYVTGGGRVTVLNPALERIGQLDAPGATNVAFGGEDGRTLYVTALGDDPGLYHVRLNVPGLPY